MSASGCNSAQVDWTAPLDNGGAVVAAYQVEWFREASFDPFFEVAEVQRISASASSIADFEAGGTFTIATNGFDIELPGTVALEEGSNKLTTTVDLTSFVRRGAQLLIRPKAEVVGTGAALTATVTIGSVSDGLLS